MEKELKKTKERMHSVGEVKLTYQRVNVMEQPVIRTSRNIYEIALKICDKELLDYKEQCWVILMNQAAKVLGYYLVGEGGLSSAPADIRVIFQAALLSSATVIAIFHNHPAGEPNPSRQDDELTLAVTNAGKFMDIPLVDHVIVTSENGYYSYADHGRL